MRIIPNEELNRLSTEEFSLSPKMPYIIVADNIRSLNNIGSLFRSCDAFAATSIYLCGISATPPNKEIHKTALGAEFSIDWLYFEKTTDAVSALKEKGYTIVAIEQVEGAKMLNQYTPDPDKRYAIVLGNEVKGVSQEVVDMCDEAIEIPQIGTKHSLNVSVAGGVILWHMFMKLH